MNPKNKVEKNSEVPTLSKKKRFLQDSNFMLIMFFIIAIIIVATHDIWNNKKSKKKNSTFDDLAFKKDLAKQYGVKIDTFINWLTIVCPEGCGIEIICSPIKKLPKEIVYLYLGVPETGKDYSKAALAKECNVSRNVLNNHLKKIEWPDTDMMISREDYKKLRVLPPRIFEMLRFMHELHYPPYS